MKSLLKNTSFIKLVANIDRLMLIKSIADLTSSFNEQRTTLMDQIDVIIEAQQEINEAV